MQHRSHSSPEPRPPSAPGSAAQKRWLRPTTVRHAQRAWLRRVTAQLPASQAFFLTNDHQRTAAAYPLAGLPLLILTMSNPHGCAGPQDSPLFNWLAALYPAWATMTGADAYVSAKLAMAELLLSGCTCTSGKGPPGFGRPPSGRAT